MLSDGVGLTAHVQAWGELLCTTAGLPPLPAGVVLCPPGGHAAEPDEAHGDGDRRPARACSTVTSSPPIPTPAEPLSTRRRHCRTGRPAPEQSRPRIASLSRRVPARSPSTPSARTASATPSVPTCIQLRRAGSRDPPDRSRRVRRNRPLSAELGDAIADAEWVIHAASQDLPCLFEVGMTPARLFDTELAARLLDYPRVALGTMIEELLVGPAAEGALGLGLVEAARCRTSGSPTRPWTWSCWSSSATVLAAQLVEAGKDGWAPRSSPPSRPAIGAAGRSRDATRGGARRASTRYAPAADWRTWRSSGMRETRSPGTADRAPWKILPDVAISDLAASPPKGADPTAALCGGSLDSPPSGPPVRVRLGGRPRRVAARAEADLPFCTCPATVRRSPDSGRPRIRSPPRGWRGSRWRSPRSGHRGRRSRSRTC